MTNREMLERINQRKRASSTCYFVESLRRLVGEIEVMHGPELALPLAQTLSALEIKQRAYQALAASNEQQGEGR